MKPKPKKLLGRVRDAIRVKHYSFRVEQTYVESGAHWARLRVKDIEFVQHQIIVRDTKGNKDRVTMLPERIVMPLKAHLVEVKKMHELALANGYGTVEMPYALARKYPNAESEWLWQYIFPAKKPSVDLRSGVIRRHHLDESVLQKAVRRAAQQTNITKHVTPHIFRHCLPPIC